jgi:sec-independent protein translocase protein TatB
MFDIGFSELILVAVVALLVIGPERLPGVARTAGMWIGRARRFINSVQADINAEISKTDELKRLLDEQHKLKAMHEIIEETVDEVREGAPVPRAKPTQKLKAVDSNPAGTESETEAKPADSKHG